MQNFHEEAYLKTVNSDIGTLHGIGAKRSEAFKRLGVYTVSDLTRHFPRAYQNRGNVRLLSEGIEGESCSYLLTIGTQPRSTTLRSRKTITKFRAFDESGTVEITYFNSRYLEDVFRVGETHRFWGKLAKTGKRYIMSAPVHEAYYEEGCLPDFTPIYPASAGLSQGFITEAVEEALRRLLACGVPDIVPEALRSELLLPTASAAYRGIHRPTSREELEEARRYFAAEQTYLFALGLAATKHRKRSGIPPAMDKVDMTPLVEALGFPLTGAQKRSINEIYGDMVKAELPMSRLLSGNVGSGKTAVAAAALYIALKNGYQGALMAPTEILASQHYETFEDLFGKLGFRVGLLLGSSTAAAKRNLRRMAEEGEIDLLIGTHSLLTDDTAFARLGL
ncbi:MAG: DEAD/DEAH box helicase, partial [Clostridia bacterium]|nr:DEAD/DEAH box helicase [Clostridia bacterium]